MVDNSKIKSSDKIKVRKVRKFSLPKELAPLIEKAKGKICVVIHPDKQYVDYIKKNIIVHIEAVMDQFNIEVKTLSSSIRPQESNYNKILELLKECIIGIVILDGLRPNVILEYGILLGLDKPVIALKDKEAYINVESLYLPTNESKGKVKKIENLALNINEHLSDVKDLHWTEYDWKDPAGFKEVLNDAFIKIKEKILKEIAKTTSPKEIAAQKPEIYNKFQKAFKELAEYTIKSKLRKEDYDEIVKLNKKINALSERYKIQLSPNYYFDLGYVYCELSKYDGAIKAYDKAIKINPDFAEAWNNKGVALGNLGRYEEELEACDKATEINPNFAEVWNNKGFALANLGRYEGALKSYDKATEIKPDYAKAWYNKGFALGNLGRYWEALEAYDKVIEIKPDFAEAWNNKGFALDNLGRYDEALKACDKAIEIKPDLALAWNNKGLALHNLGRYEEALKAYDKAIEIKPDLALAWYNKGIVLGNLGRYEEALKAYDKAIEIKPDYALAWNNKGVALDNLGRYEEELEAYDKAIEINPDFADVWYNKAFVYSLKRDKESALKNLTKAIELEPKYKEKAKKDEDFKNLWDDDDFKRLVE